MPDQGLEVYDYLGNLVTGVGTSTWKTLTSVNVVNTDGSLALTIPPGATPVVSVVGEPTAYIPTASITGSTLNWSRPAGTSQGLGRINVSFL